MTDTRTDRRHTPRLHSIARQKLLQPPGTPLSGRQIPLRFIVVLNDAATSTSHWFSDHDIRQVAAPCNVPRGEVCLYNGTTTTTVVIITILSHIRDRDVLAWKSMMLMLTCWYGCTRMIHGQLVGDSRLDTTPVDVVSSVELISSQSSSDAVFVTKQSPTYC